MSEIRARSNGKGANRSGARERFQALRDEMRSRICLLAYPPGMHLSEEELAAEFGVSRTPIRRVMSWLESEGLVESRHGVGTVVTEPDLALLGEIYVLRMRLAELIGEFSPRPRGPADFVRLELLAKRGRALRDRFDGAQFSRINMAFQEELAATIGNRALRAVSQRLYYQTARFFLQSSARMDMREEVEIFLGEMAEIIAALRRRDFRAVGFIRRNHIAWSFQRMTGTTPDLAAATAPDAE